MMTGFRSSDMCWTSSTTERSTMTPSSSYLKNGKIHSSTLGCEATLFRHTKGLKQKLLLADCRLWKGKGFNCVGFEFDRVLHWKIRTVRIKEWIPVISNLWNISLSLCKFAVCIPTASFEANGAQKQHAWFNRQTFWCHLQKPWTLLKMSLKLCLKTSDWSPKGVSI